MLNRQDLIKVKTKALKKGVWFKTLSRIENSILDLAIQCVGRVRSNVQMKTVVTILDKVLETFEEDYLKSVERIGRQIAEGTCEIALRWGNPDAWTWKHDLRFVKFLGSRQTVK